MRVSVAIERAADVANVPLAVAKARGFYRAVGLDVTLKSIFTSQSSAQRVARGNACVAVTSPREALICSARRAWSTDHHRALTAVAALSASDERRVLVAGPEVMAEESTLRLFLAATYLGVQEATLDPTSAAHDMARLFGLEQQVQRLINECHLAQESDTPWGNMDSSEWAQAAATISGMGLVAPSIRWTNDYLPGSLSGR